MGDGYGKSPITALCFLPRRCGVHKSTPHASGVARLVSGSFSEAVLILREEDLLQENHE
jgi:hypothetical protein